MLQNKATIQKSNIKERFKEKDYKYPRVLQLQKQIKISVFNKIFGLLIIIINCKKESTVLVSKLFFIGNQLKRNEPIKN